MKNMIVRTGIFLLLFAFVLAHSIVAQAKNEWDTADKSITRLPPSAFRELPGNIVNYLKAHGYSIPQTFNYPQPHNIIKGEFRKKGSVDWACLCSRDRKSSIIIFWNGSEKDVSEIQKLPDKNRLQSWEDGKIVYSRVIGVVGKEYIMEHHRNYGGPKPPPIDHEGINDAFIGKASGVHYFFQGKWMLLTGAD